MRSRPKTEDRRKREGSKPAGLGFPLTGFHTLPVTVRRNTISSVADFLSPVKCWRTKKLQGKVTGDSKFPKYPPRIRV